VTAGSAGGTKAFIGLGSNLEEPVRQIERAIELLEGIPGTTLEVAEIRTLLDARSLLQYLQELERSQGRIRREHWGPRILDLDLLVFGDAEIDEPELTVPHPGIAVRNFVLLPLKEVAPELVIPGLGRISDIAVNNNEPRISRLD